jgi:serine/threonine-protein kinase
VSTAEVGSTANTYEILCKLAEGGMAEIFLARAVGGEGLRRHVVLKRILRTKASDRSFVKMFLEEARVAAQLQHANIAQVYDVGRLGASYFFTMEYVHGETTRGILHRAHELELVLPINAVLAIIAHAAAGLGHAHERGIVHRDVSPANLMVSFEGDVKVLDFGVAKAADNFEETKTGTVKGKIGYLSPEQCRGMKLDPRSDLFSLGIVMWELLTTRRLFRRESDFETMAAIATEPAPPPSRVRRDIPPELDALVGKLLAKSTAERYASSQQLIEDIEGLASRTGAVLSRSQLARLLRELFGTRQEPWVGIEPEQELITVSVAKLNALELEDPIPQTLDDPGLAALEKRLSSAVYTIPVPLHTDAELEATYLPGETVSETVLNESVNETVLDDPNAMTIVEPVRIEPLPPTPAPRPPTSVPPPLPLPLRPSPPSQPPAPPSAPQPVPPVMPAMVPLPVRPPSVVQPAYLDELSPAMFRACWIVGVALFVVIIVIAVIAGE